MVIAVCVLLGLSSKYELPVTSPTCQMKDCWALVFFLMVRKHNLNMGFISDRTTIFLLIQFSVVLLKF